MHSLKNTIVAVGLLGLSFLFYQASSRNSAESTELIPALEVSEGFDSAEPLAASETDASVPGLDANSNIELPDLRKPEFSNPAELGSGFATRPEDFKTGFAPAEPKAKNGPAVNPFPNAALSNNSAAKGGQNFPELPFNAPPAKSTNLTPPPSPSSTNGGFTETTPLASNSSNSFDPGAPSSSPSVQRQPLDNVARDEGLISALEQQNLQADDSNSFSAEGFDGGEPANRTPSEPVSFASQPIPASDSSFNRVATDRGSENGQFATDVIRANSEPDFASLTYQAAWPQVDKFIAQEDYQNALRLLSRYYRSTELTGPQRQRLIGWLDALAGKVIFSAEHHLQSTPYTVSNESLEDIGARWKVPAQLIFNINQANIPVVSAIQPGTELKAIQGPFDAEIDLDQKIMTLFLDDLYAGRFPIVVGISGSPKPGDFQVLVKSEIGHGWRDSEGQEYAPGTPENGYGPNWIGLSGSLCIHAVSDTAQDGHHGCIGLSEQDAKDVFGILAEGSSVKILR